MKRLQLKKPTKQQVLVFLRYIFIVLAGNAIAAGASAFFIIPNGFVMGGTTGLGIFVRNLLQRSGKDLEWVISVTVYTANIALFILGAVMLGKKYAAATAAGTLLYPTFLSLWEFVNVKLDNPMYFPDQRLLGVIFGAIFFGLGIGIVVRVGASTGGTDIPPMILHRYLNLPLSIGMWGVDVSIAVLQIFAVDSIAEVLYGVLIVLLSSIVVDKVSVIGTRREQVKIISKKYEEIRKMILNKLNRGVTMLYGKTGFLREECYVVMTIVTARDIVRLRNEVISIDPEALFMVSTISEVRGRGFSSARVILPKTEEGENLKEVPQEPTDNEQKKDG